MTGTAEALVIRPKRGQFGIPRPPESHQGQWHVTPQGCFYWRARAPGHRTTWHLIIDPHHIGQPNARRGCPAML